MKKVWEFLATGFFTGYISLAPGTFGTLVGVALYVFVSPYKLAFYIMTIALIPISVLVSDYADKHIFSENDSPHIVIDEIMGFLITMMAFPFDGTTYGVIRMIVGFLLFRIFDIYKPYPVRQIQNIPGGLGIVLDDILAGIYAALGVYLFELIPMTPV